MNFFSIELDINDRRRYFLELWERGTATAATRSFVVDVPPSVSFPLLSIDAEAPFKSFVEGEGDHKLSQCSISAEQRDNIITIRAKAKEAAVEPTIAPQPKAAAPAIEDIEGYTSFDPPKKKKQNTESSHTPTQHTPLQAVNDFLQARFSMGSIGASLSLTHQQMITAAPLGEYRLTVIIELEIDGRFYENEILFYLAHPSQYLGMAIDFGSESSQMAIRRNAQQPPYNVEHAENENLFQNIYSYHRYRGWVANEQNVNYYQKEEGTLFYKSLFLLKQQLSGNYDRLDELPFIQDVEDNLLMLVSDNDITNLTTNTYHQLPNLKILHQHDTLLNALSFEVMKSGYPLPLKLKELKDKVYNTILEIMIVSFLKKEMTRYSNAQRMVRFMLLVPNNYDVIDIHKVQNQLNSIFQSLADSEQYKGWLLGWEVMTISESDASFLGFLETYPEKVKANKDFIIIDSGKGTTDFSIIRTGKENMYNVRPIYRNGFTGSGNMITYALFETLLHYLRANGAQDGTDLSFIQNKVLATLEDSRELELRNKFYEALERLKFNYRADDQIEAVRRNWQNAQNGDITLANVASKSRETELSLGTLTRLVENLSISGDLYGYVHQVCSFIAEGVVHNLKSIKENKKDMDIAGVVLTGRAFKFKLLADMVCTKLSQELGIAPQDIELLKGNALKDICIKGVFNTAIKLNAEVTGMPIQLLYHEVQELPKDKPAKTMGNWNGWLKTILGDINTMHKVTVHDAGAELQYAELPRSRFLIGSKEYYVGGDTLMREAGAAAHTISIDFTHSGFMLRRLHNGKVDLIQRLAEVRVASDLALVIPSVFPNYINPQYLESLERNVVPEYRYDKPNPQRPGSPSRDDLFF